MGELEGGDESKAAGKVKGHQGRDERLFAHPPRLPRGTNPRKLGTKLTPAHAASCVFYRRARNPRSVCRAGARAAPRASLAHACARDTLPRALPRVLPRVLCTHHVPSSPRIRISPDPSPHYRPPISSGGPHALTLSSNISDGRTVLTLTAWRAFQTPTVAQYRAAYLGPFRYPTCASTANGTAIPTWSAARRTKEGEREERVPQGGRIGKGRARGGREEGRRARTDGGTDQGEDQGKWIRKRRGGERRVTSYLFNDTPWTSEIIVYARPGAEGGWIGREDREGLMRGPAFFLSSSE
ncbi:hypothetical protein EI94DRAFT_1707179 [Lactarius quietus]|nr:hypothetical protein EI94DRAFT_1707179 [Lactarius quietus]